MNIMTEYWTKLRITKNSPFMPFWINIWGRLLFDPKILAKKCPFKLKKNWLLPYFCIRKMFSRQTVDPQIST